MMRLKWTVFFLALLLPAASAFSEEARVARVGEDGGVSGSEYEIYLQRYAREQGLSLEGMSRGDKKRALELAIDDEMLFQAALSKGVHKEKEIRDAIIADYRSRHTLEGISPAHFGEDELQSYYESHPEEFKEPLALLLKVLSFPPKSADAAEAYVQARSNPRQVSKWKDLGWVKNGDSFGALFPSQVYDSIFALRKGEVSTILKDEYGLQFIFWASDRREPKLMDFGPAREKIKFHLIREKQQQAGRKLAGELASSGGGNEDEAAFQAALKEGVHRNYDARQRIINTFISEERTTRDIMVPILHGHYDVEILRKDLKKD